mgnify:FL=1
MKILLTGIILVCLNSFSGSTFDTITKYFSINNYKWYHYYSIGGTIAILVLLIYLYFFGGIKKNLILNHSSYYLLTIFRGIFFIPVLLIVFLSLKHIPINIFTMLLMTTPFFLLIFAKVILNEKLNIISWISIIIGFCGVLIVLRPNTANLNIFIFLVLFVAVYNAFNFTIVSKYSYIASSYGFTFYQYVPFIIFSYIFFIFDPLIPTFKEIFLFSLSGIIVMISMWAWNAAYHIAGKYSSIISPFFFTQIVWGTLYGRIFFGEKFDSIAFIGIIIIIISGSIAIYNRNK